MVGPLNLQKEKGGETWPGGVGWWLVFLGQDPSPTEPNPSIILLPLLAAALSTPNVILVENSIQNLSSRHKLLPFSPHSLSVFSALSLSVH